MKTIAIITAAGQSTRMGQPKQFLKLGGQTVLERTIAVFNNCPVIDGIIIVVNNDELDQTKKLSFNKLIKIVIGGKERSDSVKNGLAALPDSAEIVLIHDGARPFVTADIIERAVEQAKKAGAVVVGIPVKDTIKQIRNSKSEIRNKSEIIITKTLNREELWQAQTPQVFKKDLIVKAYESGYNSESKVTDDSMLVEQLGIKVVMLLGSYKNIKITTPEDLIFAEGIIKEGV